MTGQILQTMNLLMLKTIFPTEVPLEVGDFAAEHNDGDPGDDFNDDLAAADRDLADLPDNYGMK